MSEPKEKTWFFRVTPPPGVHQDTTVQASGETVKEAWGRVPKDGGRPTLEDVLEIWTDDVMPVPLEELTGGEPGKV